MERFVKNDIIMPRKNIAKMHRKSLFIFILISLLSNTNAYLTCSGNCEIVAGRITVAKKEDVTFTYTIDNSQFASVVIKFDAKDVLSASTTVVTLSPGRDTRFKITSTNVVKVSNKYTFSFTVSQLEFTDVNKILAYTTRIGTSNQIRILKLDVKDGPKTCGPVKGTMSADEFSRDDFLWMVCGKPEPQVTASIGRRSFQVEKRTLPDDTYIYTVKLNNLERWQCGMKLRLEAIGFMKLVHNVDMIVAFTPPKLVSFDAQYDSVKDCVKLYWRRIEAGTCPVKYVVKYDNEFDNNLAIFYETNQLEYTKCGPEIGFNFSVRAVVNKIEGPWSDSVGKEGTGRIIGEAEGFMWYYILIIVIVILLLIIIILIIILRCRKPKVNTREIEKANSIELYLEENNKKQNGIAHAHKQKKNVPGNGHLPPAEEHSTNSNSRSKKVIFGKKKASQKKSLEPIIINGAEDNFETLTAIEKGEAKAKAEKSTKPNNDETSFRVTFQNISQNSVKLYWKDYKGNEKFCHKINPGKDHHVIAFMEYSYIARDSRTNRLIYFRKERKFDVVFKGPDFGVEIGGVNTIIISGTPELSFTHDGGDSGGGVVNKSFVSEDDRSEDGEDGDGSDGSSDIGEPPPPPPSLIYAEVAVTSQPAMSSFNPSAREGSISSSPRTPSISFSANREDGGGREETL